MTRVGRRRRFLAAYAAVVVLVAIALDAAGVPSLPDRLFGLAVYAVIVGALVVDVVTSSDQARARRGPADRIARNPAVFAIMALAGAVVVFLFGQTVSAGAAEAITAAFLVIALVAETRHRS